MFNEFKQLGSALISDVLDEAGYHSQTLDPSIAAVGEAVSFCGPAVCVQGQRQVNTVNRPCKSATMPLYGLPLLLSGPSVLVLATNGFRGGAVTGGLLAAELASAGCAGLITDGLVRDLHELSAIGLPVRAAGTIPLNGARRFCLTGQNAPVTLPAPEGGTVTIHPGDLVLGDQDGTVIVPQHAAAAILAMGKELARREEQLRQDAARMTAAERATARATRMSHVEWLRSKEEALS
ncbi:MAG: RraA family protein [Paracoccus sp. (in: a-proteobacteria)]|uniref:RraA family protein n=1 Tax=Paracoccus sp. TaxID=267 RepID=UPI0026DED8A9|nr:RraA family protein [Paracoccus sp. (in: a-proteobacteria)]MDO5614061.1 RraA family protein [Paracoccus sp. (in: a-proteobacteria)]